MPIVYAAVLNQQKKLVLQGADNSTRTYFKSYVEELAKSCEIPKFQTRQHDLDAEKRIILRNMDTVTAGILITNDILLQECGDFFDNFFEFLEFEVLSMGKNNLTMQNSKYGANNQQKYQPP